jgi:hypothetical protein
MKYIYTIMLMVGLAANANATQISKEKCEEVWADGEILHEFDELEVVGGNYRPRSYIRYDGAIYYGILTINSVKGENANVWVDMNCWNSDIQK